MEGKRSKLGDAFFFSLLFFFAFVSYLIYKPFIKLVIVSILIVIIFYPLKLKLDKTFKSEIVSSFLATSIVFLFIIIPSVILVIFFVNQALNLYPLVVSTVSNGEILNLIQTKIPFFNEIKDFFQDLIDKFNIDLNINEFVKKYLAIFIQFIVEQGKILIVNITIVILSLIFMGLLLFFLFKDGDKLYKRVFNLIPLPDKDKVFIVNKAYQAIQGVVLGSILTAIAQGILGFIAYFIAGIEFSLFWAFLTFLASFIPIGGASLVWVPLGIYIFITDGLIKAILFVLWGFLVISMVDNIIKPWIIGDKTDIHPIILFFAILGGLNLFGFLGIFLAPIIVVLLDNFLQLYQERYHISE